MRECGYCGVNLREGERLICNSCACEPDDIGERHCCMECGCDLETADEILGGICDECYDEQG